MEHLELLAHHLACGNLSLMVAAIILWAMSASRSNDSGNTQSVTLSPPATLPTRHALCPGHSCPLTPNCHHLPLAPLDQQGKATLHGTKAGRCPEPQGMVLGCVSTPDSRCWGLGTAPGSLPWLFHVPRQHKRDCCFHMHTPLLASTSVPPTQSQVSPQLLPCFSDLGRKDLACSAPGLRFGHGSVSHCAALEESFLASF